jgi:hypothetical protein
MTKVEEIVQLELPRDQAELFAGLLRSLEHLDEAKWPAPSIHSLRIIFEQLARSRSVAIKVDGYGRCMPMPDFDNR